MLSDELKLFIEKIALKYGIDAELLIFVYYEHKKYRVSIKDLYLLFRMENKPKKRQVEQMIQRIYKKDQKLMKIAKKNVRNYDIPY